MNRVRRSKVIVAASILFAAVFSLGAGSPSAWNVLRVAFRKIAKEEPMREGPLHDATRGSVALVHGPDNPGLSVVEPAEMGEFDGLFEVEMYNWIPRPNLATNPIEEFANGFQERNTGHVHGWVFNQASEQVRFYGAGSLVFHPVGDRFYVEDSFPPGVYKAYFQLQNHDHTPPIQARAPDFPAITSVTFIVSP